MVGTMSNNLIINIQSKYFWFSKSFNCYCSISFFILFVSFTLCVEISLLFSLLKFFISRFFLFTATWTTVCTWFNAHIFSSLFLVGPRLCYSYYHFGFCHCHILFHHFHVILCPCKNYHLLHLCCVALALDIALAIGQVRMNIIYNAFTFTMHLPLPIIITFCPPF